jgi:5-methylcytosine-specific restriction endonuclease McrA
LLLTKTVTYYGKKIKVKNLSENSNKKVKVKCPNCGKIRETYYKSYIKSKTDMCQPCTVKTTQSKTLSPGSKYNMLTVIKPSSESGKSICLCDCGNKKEVDNYQMKSGKTKSCGCLKKENFKNAKKVKGEHHGMWLGGSSSKRERLMQSKKYKDWRDFVYRKYNYKCQKCGQKGYDLNCHHIKPYNQYEELATDKSNGTIFCESCHKKFHYIYGYKDFGEKEYNEYINGTINGRLNNGRK